MIALILTHSPPPIGPSLGIGHQGPSTDDGSAAIVPVIFSILRVDFKMPVEIESVFPHTSALHERTLHNP